LRLNYFVDKKGREIVEFGHYFQCEITGIERTSKVIEANYDNNGVANVDNMRVKRIKRTKDKHKGRKVSGIYPYKYFKYEPIRWRIIEKNSESITLIADKVLECLKYNEDKVDMTWKDCSLRKWLNNDFYQVAFTGEERSVILSTNNDNGEGIRTIDKVYLLSYNEAKNMFENDEDRRVNTTYFSDRDCLHVTDGCGSWWLRTRGLEPYEASYVSEDGNINYLGQWVNSEFDVRPVIKLNLAKKKHEFYVELHRCEEITSSLQEKKVALNYINASKYIKNNIFVGDIVELGSYPQSKIRKSELTSRIKKVKYNKNGVAKIDEIKIKRFGNRYFKYEPIRWIVMDKNDGKLTLLAEQIIDNYAFNEINVKTSWESCTLRKWLNNDFYGEAFSVEEKNVILSSKNDNNSGGRTTDKVYLLSKDEVKYMFGLIDDNRITNATDFAKRKGLHIGKYGNSFWSLRSSHNGYDEDCVGTDGDIDDYDDFFYIKKDENVDPGVRPALQILY